MFGGKIESTQTTFSDHYAINLEVNKQKKINLNISEVCKFQKHTSQLSMCQRRNCNGKLRNI